MDKNKKSKSLKKASIRKGISLSLAALTLAGPIVPYAVYANPTAAIEQNLAKAPEAKSAYPRNIVDEINWDNKGVTDADKDYWSLNQQLGIEPAQKIVRVTKSDPIRIVDVNYQGYFVDAEGRTNLRLVYSEISASISAVWNKALIRFDPELYDLIDFDKSFGIAENGKTYALNASNGAYERSIDVSKLVGNRTQNRNNIPINLVLRDGKTIANLGSKNYKVQMRLVDSNSKRIFAFAPKGTSVDYSTYTRQTVIPGADNIDGLFLRGPREDDGKKFAMQRSFMSEFIANPEEYPDTSNLGILRTEYEAERDSTNPKDVKDGKPAGFIQAFDAELVNYFKADNAGNIAYTNLLDGNRKEIKGVNKQGIKPENINYSADGKIAYIVFGQSNFKKDGVKVVSLDKFSGKINQSGYYFTAIDYVVDKTKFQETFETTGTTKVDFNIMTGWAETNPQGWTIFEKDYDNDHVVDEGESFMIDTTQDPARKQIMIQVGDPEEALIRTMQGYYAGHKDLSSGFEQIKNIGVGLYEFTLREGATIKAGEKFRILIPDSADHEGPVNFLETHNGSKYNQGAAKLKLQADRNINMHLYRKDKGSFKVYYTLKGETEQKVLEFTKGGLWKYKDTDKILDGIPNKAVDPSGGNFWINTKKLEPGKDIIVEAYNAAGEKEENLTSWFKYKPLEKSAEKYERMAWVDHAETLASVGIDKSTYVPYQEIFTNDYKTGTDEIYKDSRALPEGKEDFMNKANKIEGFTQYDGGKIRMRYIESDGKTLVGKAEAAANEYNDKGEVVGTDLSQKVTINGKEYDAMPYEIDLSTVSELRDADPETGLELKKDMRLIFNASNGSSIPSDWYDTRVKTRVLFDTTDGQFADASKKVVKIAPDNVKYAQEDGYVANGFTGDNVKEGTGDAFPEAPTADGKTFLGWATKAGYEALGSKPVVTSAEYENLTNEQKFTETTPITSHEMAYAIWSEEKLVTFDANGGKFADGSTTKTDDITDGVTAPENPTQEGKTFVGWASTKDATEAEEGILDNVTEAKTVYAVWKDGAQEESAKPTITEPKAGDTSVSGTGVPGATVVLKDKDGNKIGEATVDKDGNWTVENIPADKLVEGEKVTAEQTEPGKKPATKDAIVAARDEETSVDTTGKKPVDPTDEKQNTGVKVENKDKDTKISAKDEDGKDVPVEIDENGNVIVTPGTDVDGPINVTITDPDLPNGKVEVEVPVNGHKKDKDDNGSETPEDKKTTIDESGKKPVEPTDKDQGTGVIVNNPEGTTITAEDEDGKYVPVTIDPATGEIIVNPGKDVDGPIKVTIKDKDGKVRVIYIDVIGHSMGIDDNDSEYRPGHDGSDYFDGIFKRHDYTPTYPVKTVVPEKTQAATPVRDTLWYVFHINEFEYEVVRNGVVTKRLMDVTPVLQNGRTMLPLRYVAEAIGAEVKWDKKTRTATFIKDGLTASIQIDSDEIVLSNGKTVKMDSKPLNINDRILVSVTNVANVFGLTNGNTQDKIDQDIEWEQEDKSATIYVRR